MIIPLLVFVYGVFTPSEILGRRVSALCLSPRKEGGRTEAGIASFGYSSPWGRESQEYPSQPAVDDVRFVSERNGWLPFACTALGVRCHLDVDLEFNNRLYALHALRITTETFVPPKPKAFTIAVGTACSRAALGT